MSADKFWRYKAEVEERMERTEREKVGSEKHLEIHGGLREGIGMKRYLHGPMGFAKTLELAISCRGPGPARKKKEVYQ